MICLACRGVTRGDLCLACERRLHDAPDRVVPEAVLVRSAHLHDGPARQLVHRLKYDGLVCAADRLAAVMAPLTTGASMLVPVPRTTARRQRYGIDPALELARVLARLTGLPVVPGLRPVMRGRVHAGRGRGARSVPTFRVGADVDAGACVVDDVVTTGVTVSAAARLLGAERAVTATSRILASSSSAIRPKHQ